MGGRQLIPIIAGQVHIRNGPFRGGLFQTVIHLRIRQCKNFARPTVHSDLAELFIETCPGDDSGLRNARTSAAAQRKVHLWLTVNFRILPASEMGRWSTSRDLEDPNKFTFIFPSPTDIMEGRLEGNAFRFINVSHHDLWDSRTDVPFFTED